MPTVNENLFDAAVQRAVELQLFGNRATREIIETLKEFEPRLWRIIASMGDRETVSFTEFRRGLPRIKVLLNRAYEKVERNLDGIARDLTRAETDWINRLFGAALSGIVATTAIDARDVRRRIKNQPFAGSTLDAWVKGLKTSQIDRIERAVRQGYFDGDTNARIIQRVRGRRVTRFTDGIISTGYRQAETIVRTLINSTANRTYDRYYESNSRLIKGVQWRSTLDGRTSAICRSRDGRIWPVSEGPRPPAHLNCRSVIIPVLKSARQLGLGNDIPQSTRSSIDGQVPEELNYGEWLRTKSRPFVEMVLGKRKAKLFIDGNLPMSRFVNQAGRELNLDQLFQLQPEAFARAGLTP